jgi:hypothetical protein
LAGGQAVDWRWKVEVMVKFGCFVVGVVEEEEERGERRWRD